MNPLTIGDGDEFGKRFTPDNNCIVVIDIDVGRDGDDKVFKCPPCRTWAELDLILSN